MRSSAEKETRVHSLPLDQPFNSYGLHTLLMSSESDTRITTALEDAKEEVMRSINEKQELINNYRFCLEQTFQEYNKYKGDKVKVILVLGIRVMLLALGETMQADRQGLLNATTVKTEDLDTYDSNCDDISNAQAVLMDNISNYGSEVILEVLHSETYLNDMENQGVYAAQDFEQPQAVDFTDNKIHSDSNIIFFSQYLQETQQENVQDTHLQAQQDLMILSVIEQMSKQMINHVNNWEKANKEQNNESVTDGLERYKERVKTFEQRHNIDLSSPEKND
ncbi:hypothetical protein Tco_0204675 [Tanacetum coccineum]